MSESKDRGRGANATQDLYSVPSLCYAILLCDDLGRACRQLLQGHYFGYTQQAQICSCWIFRLYALADAVGTFKC